MNNINKDTSISFFSKVETGYKYLLSIASLFFLFSLPLIATEAEDDYLQALEAEANAIQPDSPKTDIPSKPEAPANNKSGTESQRVTSNQRIEFERSLNQRLPKSYTTYLTLNDENKSEVIRSYFSNSKQMHLAIRTLYKLHFNKK